MSEERIIALAADISQSAKQNIPRGGAIKGSSNGFRTKEPPPSGQRMQTHDDFPFFSTNKPNVGSLISSK